MLLPPDVSGPHHEPWFDFDYLTWRVPASTFASMASSPCPADLAFPKPNPYVPTRFDAVPLDDEDRYRPKNAEQAHGEENREETNAASPAPVPSSGLLPPPPPPATPTLLSSSPRLRVWHSRDWQFGQPRACAYVRITSAALYASARACAATHLALKLFEDALSEDLYCADLGGLACNAWFEGLGGIDVRFDGFYDKLGTLVRQSFAKGLGALVQRGMGAERSSSSSSPSPPPLISRSDFVRVREALEKRYRNANHDAGTFATYLRLRALRSPSFDAEAVADAVAALEPADVTAAVRNAFGAADVFVECLFHGELTRTQARDLAHDVLQAVAKVGRRGKKREKGHDDDDDGDDIAAAADVDTSEVSWPFSGRAPPEAAALLARPRAPGASALPLPIPSSSSSSSSSSSPSPCPLSLVHRSLATSASGRNSVAEVYLQIGPDSDRVRALVDLLEQVAGEPIYDTLRTKEQLGYTVHSGTRLTHGVLGFAVVVVSAARGPRFLDGRIERFLRGFRDTIATMPEETLEAHKASLVASKRRKDRALADEADRAWEQIVARGCAFDAREREVLVVEKATKQDLLELYDLYIMPNDEFEEEEQEEDTNEDTGKAKASTTSTRTKATKAKAKATAPETSGRGTSAPSRRTKLAIHVVAHGRKEEMEAPLRAGEIEVKDLDAIEKTFELHRVQDPTLTVGKIGGKA